MVYNDEFREYWGTINRQHGYGHLGFPLTQSLLIIETVVILNSMHIIFLFKRERKRTILGVVLGHQDWLVFDNMFQCRFYCSLWQHFVNILLYSICWCFTSGIYFNYEVREGGGGWLTGITAWWGFFWWGCDTKHNASCVALPFKSVQNWVVIYPYLQFALGKVLKKSLRTSVASEMRSLIPGSSCFWFPCCHERFFALCPSPWPWPRLWAWI